MIVSLYNVRGAYIRLVLKLIIKEHKRKEIERKETEAKVIQSRDKTITELRVENERLKLELEQAKKKSKGFFHWLFS